MLRIKLLGFSLLLMMAPRWIQAQGSAGEITGFVTGPNRTFLAGALVTVRNLDTGTTVSLVAGTRGAYRASGLPSGTYELKAELQGFAPKLASGIALAAGETRTVDMDLSIAAIQEIVVVIGAAPRDSLEAAEARESPARDVGEALAETPGVWKLRKGGIANDIVLRGFQSRDLNVLIDGQRIYGACPNHMDPPAFHADFAEVDRVELGKGPFDVKNQGSLGGVINIVTRRPEKGFHAGADLSTGSFGFVNPSATASYGTSRFTALGGYSYRQSRPFTDGSGKQFTEYVNYLPNALDSDAFRVGTAWGKMSFSPATNQLLQVSYTRQQSDHVLYPYLQMDAAYDNADRVNFAYQIDRPAGLLSTVRAHAYFTRVDHWMTDEYRTSSANMARAYSMGTMAATNAYGGRIETVLRRMTIGMETYRRTWNATTQLAGMGYKPQYSIPYVKTDSIGVYAEYHQPLAERLQMDLGGRIDTTRSYADPVRANTTLYYAYNSTPSTSATDNQPSGNLRLSYGALHGMEFSLGVGHTSRVPEPQERYMALRRMGSDWVGNPALAASRNTGVDGTISFRHSGLYLSTNGYFNRVTDYVTINRQPKLNLVSGVMNAYARSYQNVNARLYGGELETVYGLTQRIYFSGNLSYVRGSQSLDPVHGITSTVLPEMPPLASRAGLRYATGRFSGEIEGVFAGAQRRVNTDLQEAPTPGYGIANLKLVANFRQFTLRATLNNLFNRLYYEYLSFQRDPFRTGSRVYEPGRNLYMNLSYRF